ncbi:O-antigen ligase family protein [Levilactobacillus bambusae]|nr:O-antigen ligase family protein [Levilactobacillus bambusae]
MAKLTHGMTTGFAFLLGLFACTDSVYLILVGQTPILWVYVVALMLLLWVGMTDRSRLVTALSRVSPWYWAFLVVCFFSIIPMTAIFIYQPTIMRSFFNGQISLWLATGVYLAVLCLPDRLPTIFRGVWWGIVINVFWSVGQYVFWRGGQFFSLYTWFPQANYLVSLPWSAQQTQDADVSFITAYRASGLFLETSYYVVFLIAALVVTLYFQRLTLGKWLVILMMLSFLVISRSANTVLLVVLLVMYCWLMWDRRHDGSSVLLAAQLIIVGGLLVIGLVILAPKMGRVMTENDVWGAVKESLQTLDLRDQGNQERYQNMQIALGQYQDHWFGVGYNMLSSYLELNAGPQLKTTSAFNWFINLLLEVGPLGLLVYVCMMVNWIWRTWARGRLGKLTSLTLIAICAVQFANGVKLFPIFMIIFAVASLLVKPGREPLPDVNPS